MKNIVVALCLLYLLNFDSVCFAQYNPGFYAARNAHKAWQQRNNNLDEVLKITKNDYYTGLEIFTGKTVKKSERKSINPLTYKPFKNLEESFNYEKIYHKKYKKGYYATRDDALAMHVKRKSLEKQIKEATNHYYKIARRANIEIRDTKPINPDTGKPFNNLYEYMKYLSRFY